MNQGMRYKNESSMKTTVYRKENRESHRNRASACPFVGPEEPAAQLCPFTGDHFCVCVCVKALIVVLQGRQRPTPTHSQRLGHTHTKKVAI